MKIDKNVISKTAKLARLELSDEEKEEFSKQISDIIGYVEKINELKTEDIPPADHIVMLTNVFRKDQVAESIDINEIKKISPRFEDGHFVVPRIIEG